MSNEPAPSGLSGLHRDEAIRHALLALNAQRPRDAELIARDLLKADPRHARALHILGAALLMQGRAEEAIAPLESAARGQRDPEIETQLGVALRWTGQHQAALQPFKRATRRNPPYADAFRELGNLLVFLERYEEAVDALRRGLELAPMMPALSIQLGYALLALRRCVEAQAVFAGALEISPTAPQALYGMAKAHQEVGSNRAAAEYFRRYLITTPGDQNARLCLGHCLLELGDLDAGYDSFRMAARGDLRAFGAALGSLAAAARGRFWLKPSAAARFLRSADASVSTPGTVGDKSRLPD